MKPSRPQTGSITGGSGAAVRAVAVAAVMLAALAVRWWAAAGNGFPTVDGTQYLDQAWQIAFTGQVPYSCFPPGWPALVAVPLRFRDAGDPHALLASAQLLNVLLGVLLTWLTWRLLRPRLGFGPALAGAAVVAFLPQLVILAKSDLSDLAYACGLLGGWLLLERRRDLPAGLVLGFTYLVRPESALASLALIAWRWRGDRRLPWRLALGHAVFVLPYLAFLKVAGGGWDVSSKTVALSQTLEAYPGTAYLGVIARNLGLLAPLLTGQLGLPLALLAAYGTARHRGAWAWLLAPLLSVPLVINPMVVRFWLPYLPLLLLGAGLGARSLVKLAVARGRGARVPAIILGVAVAAGLAVAAIDDAPFIHRETEAYYGLKDAGLWLRGSVTREALVADYKPYAAYWAGCRFLKYPELDSAREYALWAANHGVDYLVVNVQTVRQYLPGLDGLLVSPLPPELAARLELVQTFFYERVGDNTVVYRVRR
jgi:hypothetical protein